MKITMRKREDRAERILILQNIKVLKSWKDWKKKITL